MKKSIFAPILALAFCVAASFASPALAFDACLGAKVTECLAAIRPYVGVIDYQTAQQNIERFLAGDIAGVHKPKGVLSLAYYSRYADQADPPQLLLIDYKPSLETSQISISLRKGAGTAETADEYQATHMYDAALFALGTQENCREMATPRDFYLFFHTRVRPRLKEKKQERVEGVFNPPSSFYAETGWIGLCGKKMNYVVSSAEWGAVQEDMTRKFGAHDASLVFR